MPFSWFRFFLILCLSSFLAHAQTAAGPSLRQMTTAAGYIFAGTVMTVERAAAVHPNEVETIRITFRVDEGVRGVRTHQMLTIREWAGLWNNGERYRPGERVVLMLYRPSQVGLTSPVGGGMGKFALDRDGNLDIAAGQSGTLARDPVAGPWLGSRNHASGSDFVRVLRRVAKE